MKTVTRWFVFAAVLNNTVGGRSRTGFCSAIIGNASSAVNPNYAASVNISKTTSRNGDRIN